jgi:hypothetical protein
MTQTAETRLPDRAEIEGRLDAVANGRVYGWAWDRNRPGDVLEIEVRLAGPSADDRPLASGKADLPRTDLQANGVGDGRHAFEAVLDLPEGVDPSRVIAVARSPSTGDVAVLRQPSDGERLVEQSLHPHLARIGIALEAAAREQQQTSALQQGLVRAMRDLQKQIPADGAAALAELREAAGASGTRLDEVEAGLERIEGRVEAVEVFLMRIDGSLREMSASIAKHAGEPTSRRLQLIVAVGAGVALAAGAELILHMLLR